ncbi:MAG: group III truncated hemoglobin [Bacteroidota bacterium]
MRQDIQSRGEIEILVRTFYGKVRKHPEIGPIFNQVVDDWESHFQTITNFWQTNLWSTKTYSNNPVQKHIAVDQEVQNQIEQAHFGFWLQLWFETVDELYEGQNAHTVKQRARNMAGMFFMRIYQARETDPS